MQKVVETCIRACILCACASVVASEAGSKHSEV